MSNPAELLHNTFTKWSENRKSSVAASDTRKDDNVLSEHRRCISYLSQIEEVLTTMDESGARVAPYRRMFPNWVAHVFRFPGNWGSPDADHRRNHMMDVLEALIDPMNGVVPRLDQSRFDELKTYLDTVEKQLMEDDSLTRVVRDSALAVVRNLRTMIDDYVVVGDFALERGLQSLLGRLAYIMVSSKQGQRWKSVIDKFFIPYLVNQVPAIPVGELFQLSPGS